MTMDSSTQLGRDDDTAERPPVLPPPVPGEALLQAPARSIVIPRSRDGSSMVEAEPQRLLAVGSPDHLHRRSIDDWPEDTWIKLRAGRAEAISLGRPSLISGGQGHTP